MSRLAKISRAFPSVVVSSSHTPPLFAVNNTKQNESYTSLKTLKTFYGSSCMAASITTIGVTSQFIIYGAICDSITQQSLGASLVLMVGGIFGLRKSIRYLDDNNLI